MLGSKSKAPTLIFAYVLQQTVEFPQFLVYAVSALKNMSLTLSVQHFFLRMLGILRMTQKLRALKNLKGCLPFVNIKFKFFN